MIDGISITGYRSFGSAETRIHDLAKVNIFIGKNNCGKSNILRFVNRLDEFVRTPASSTKLDPLLDYCLDDKTRSIKFGFQLKREGYTKSSFEAVLKTFGPFWPKTFPEMIDEIWFEFMFNPGLEPSEESVNRFKKNILERMSHSDTNALTHRLKNYTGGSPEQRAEDIASALHLLLKPQMDVKFINAFRRISETGDNPLSGTGLIKELRKLQSPQLANYNQGKQRFAQIVEFVRSILGESDAQLEIPAEKDEIYVSIRKKVLPLESLGTGIHELIIIASAVTLVDGVIFCIEEPGDPSAP